MYFYYVLCLSGHINTVVDLRLSKLRQALINLYRFHGSILNTPSVDPNHVTPVFKGYK